MWNSVHEAVKLELFLSRTLPLFLLGFDVYLCSALLCVCVFWFLCVGGGCRLQKFGDSIRDKEGDCYVDVYIKHDFIEDVTDGDRLSY